MVFGISEQDCARIEAAIRDAESRTAGQIVTVVAERADSYAYIRILWACFAAMLVPAGFLLTAPAEPLATAYLVQLAVFVAASGVVLLTPLGLRTVPRSVKRRRAAALAREQFHDRGVDSLANGAGILLFVAFEERYVEIIADQGIHGRVSQADWDDAIARFTGEVRAGRVADGFLGAIGACGALLIAHFPKQAADDEDLPNHLILI